MERIFQSPIFVIRPIINVDGYEGASGGGGIGTVKNVHYKIHVSK